MERTTTLVGQEILGSDHAHSFRSYYVEVMQRLHGEDFNISGAEMARILTSSTELVVAVFFNGYLVSTAQATLCQSPPQYHVYINNVVTRASFGGKGYGRLAVEALEKHVSARWGNWGRPLQIWLSNSPRKGNADFYKALGYRARTEENNDPTVVWVKDL